MRMCKHKNVYIKAKLKSAEYREWTFDIYEHLNTSLHEVIAAQQNLDVFASHYNFGVI